MTKLIKPGENTGGHVARMSPTPAITINFNGGRHGS